MSFTQHAVDCREHDDCTAIVCTRDEDGAAVWTSHWEAGVHPADRMNVDYPCHDKRGQQSIHADGTPLTPTAAA